MLAGPNLAIAALGVGSEFGLLSGLLVDPPLLGEAVGVAVVLELLIVIDVGVLVDLPAVAHIDDRHLHNLVAHIIPLDHLPFQESLLHAVEREEEGGQDSQGDEKRVGELLVGPPNSQRVPLVLQELEVGVDVVVAVGNLGLAEVGGGWSRGLLEGLDGDLVRPVLVVLLGGPVVAVVFLELVESVED
eukprot:CAMPEP_0168614718 /NCGR_PEP_ID=MMETSP0449_2-20121227/4128_1 /TAXON_ID=1082188 /ORGANISM="Strombidium rassoulzadegani, Strain ras09" /LENGTH=187 /DNA_ID=CAMNT_0008655425 /DNA_START=381 /DNA_END=944 /DNA_ORIENTATION=+